MSAFLGKASPLLVAIGAGEISEPEVGEPFEKEWIRFVCGCVVGCHVRHGMMMRAVLRPSVMSDNGRGGAWG
jgi:hypothetical protein